MGLYFSDPLSFNDPYDFDLECLRVTKGVGTRNLVDQYADRLSQAADAAAWMVDRLVDRYLETNREDRGPMDASPAVDIFRSKAGLLHKALAALGDGNSGSASERVACSWDKLRQELAGTYGVRCYSSSPTQMLLWSHYASGHRGVCLEFDSAKRPVRGWKHFDYLPVAYSDGRSIDVLSVGFDAAFASLLTTKGVEWAYELEHRLITLRGHGMQPGLLPSLSGVILGARAGANRTEQLDRLFDAIARNQDRRRGPGAISLSAAEEVPGRFDVALRHFARLEELRGFVAEA